MDPKKKKPSFISNEPYRLGLKDLADDVKPAPGETWIHHHHGVVSIIRRWNKKECVCEVSETGKRVLLMDTLLMARMTIPAPDLLFCEVRPEFKDRFMKHVEKHSGGKLKRRRDLEQGG